MCCRHCVTFSFLYTSWTFFQFSKDQFDRTKFIISIIIPAFLPFLFDVIVYSPFWDVEIFFSGGSFRAAVVAESTWSISLIPVWQWFQYLSICLLFQNINSLYKSWGLLHSLLMFTFYCCNKWYRAIALVSRFRRWSRRPGFNLPVESYQILCWRCPWCNGYRRRKWTRRHESDCISHSTNTFGKGMNPIILPPAMGK